MHSLWMFHSLLWIHLYMVLVGMRACIAAGTTSGQGEVRDTPFGSSAHPHLVVWSLSVTGGIAPVAPARCAWLLHGAAKGCTGLHVRASWVTGLGAWCLDCSIAADQYVAMTACVLLGVNRCCVLLIVWSTAYLPLLFYSWSACLAVSLWQRTARLPTQCQGPAVILR
jgi:hypothetical protein